MIDISKKIKINRITSDDGNYFFGYYDISPESPDGSKVLVNKAPFIDRMPNENDELEIGYIDTIKYEFHVIGKTTAWNFQEGCRLQWLDDNRIIYNARNTNNDGFHSVVYDIEARKIIQEYTIPIVTLSLSKEIAICHSFIRNKYCYPYEGKLAQEIDIDGGLFLLDLKTGESKCVIKMKELCDTAETMGLENWVEHCVINPEGNRFFFLQRWVDKSGAILMNLCVSELNGKFKVLLKNSFVSHAGWRGNDQISVWCRMPSGINAIQKGGLLRRNPQLYSVLINIYHSIFKSNKIRNKIANDSYVIFDIENNASKKIKNDDLITDGHDTWSANQRYMLTDTYPDKEGNRLLMVYDSRENKVLLLGSFFSFPRKDPGIDGKWNSSPMRCDLHPKQTFSQNNIYFDSVHEGYRGLYCIKISDYLGGWNDAKDKGKGVGRKFDE